MLDDGSLLAQIPWPRRTTYGTLCDIYVSYVTVKNMESIVILIGMEMFQALRIIFIVDSQVG